MKPVFPPVDMDSTPSGGPDSSPYDTPVQQLCGHKRGSRSNNIHRDLFHRASENATSPTGFCCLAAAVVPLLGYCTSLSLNKPMARRWRHDLPQPQQHTLDRRFHFRTVYVRMRKTAREEYSVHPWKREYIGSTLGLFVDVNHATGTIYDTCFVC